LIFVTVGTPRDFSRLIKKVDEITKDLNHEIIVQRGNTRYKPKNCESFTFTSRDKFLNYVKNADIVITHGGVGSIIDSLKYGKPTIVVPRRKMFNEHRNDHQMDITRELENEGKILACYDINDLKKKIREVKKFRLIKRGEEKERIKKILNNFIKNSMR